MPKQELEQVTQAVEELREGLTRLEGEIAEFPKVLSYFRMLQMETVCCDAEVEDSTVYGRFTGGGREN